MVSESAPDLGPFPGRCDTLVTRAVSQSLCLKALVREAAPFACIEPAAGWVCGAEHPNAKGLLQFDVTPGGQGTGAPVFVVDRAAADAVLIAIYRRNVGVEADDPDPALERLRAKAALDPAVKPVQRKNFLKLVTAVG